MSNKDNDVSAAGERAAMGGYMPQFSEFAWFAYRALVHNQLEWIRIADPEAQKLDDIQYATSSEVHAYQVKWTISGDTISFTDFKNLLPSLVSSWQGLRAKHRLQQRAVFAHLLTNKALSAHDRVKCEGGEFSPFTEFFRDAWQKIKAHQSYDSKWQPAIDELITRSGLNAAEFADFINHFDFHPNHVAEDFSVTRVIYQQKDDDLEKFRSYILENVSSPARPVEVTANQIIHGLHWESRFKTTFNHDLVVDPQKYQPIASTIQTLDAKLNQHSGGYLFLSGAPGSGKSTLLTDWTKAVSRTERVIKYYAFNFSNPTSPENYHERGESVMLFFDLVFQLKEEGFYKDSVIPYKNLHYLRRVFYEQLELLGEEFAQSGCKTILLIDGLDHVPREYQQTVNSFVRELPLPNQLPTGVYVVLGSQSYDLQDLSEEIRTESRKENRTIHINPLSREAISNYINASNLSVSLTEEQKQTIVERSEGHPLYLSYLLESIQNSDDKEFSIAEIIPIEGNIDIYYRKIWQPIETDHQLITILGLMARITGPISLPFLREWKFSYAVLTELRKRAKSLFIDSITHWSFFHNSFRQFLLHHTALDGFTGDYSNANNLKLHQQLVAFYEVSDAEPRWYASFHSYQAEDYDRFLQLATPAIFLDQLMHFRPDDEIKQDIGKGLEIASSTQDVVLLTRYAIALSELQGRLRYIEPASFVREFLLMGKPELARRYLRIGNRLHTNEAFALNAARQFYDYGDRAEATLLFTLAEPSTVKASSIIVDEDLRFGEAESTLKQWVVMALHIYELPQILTLLNNIQVNDNEKRRSKYEKSTQLRLVLMDQLAERAVNQHIWATVDAVLEEINNPDYKYWTLNILKAAIREGLYINDRKKASQYLDKLLDLYTPASLNDTQRIHVADLIYWARKDIPLVLTWLDQVAQPTVSSKDIIILDSSLDEFHPFITLNKLLGICGKNAPIELAVTNAITGKKDELFVSFLRHIALTTQILADSITGRPNPTNIIDQLRPAISFYKRNPDFIYRNLGNFNPAWYPLTCVSKAYFKFIIGVTKRLGPLELNQLADYFLKEFTEQANSWPPDLQRSIITDLVKNGYKSSRVESALIALESSMLDHKDIDGRVTECRSQARAWISINEFGKAEQWLQLSLHEAAGISYRKDYQLNEWLMWLQQVNVRQPKQAPDRICQFLSYLPHVRTITEGPAFWSASKVLLETTFMWNFNAGQQQLQWQLQQNLIKPDDALDTFILSYLSRTITTQEYENILSFYTDYFLRNTQEPNHYTLRKLISRGFIVFGERLIDSHLPFIVRSIDQAPNEKRDALLEIIKEYVDKYKQVSSSNDVSHQLLVSIVEKDFSEHRNPLSLKVGYRHITEAEALSRINSYEDFISLLDQEDAVNSHFNWHNVIEKVGPMLDSSQIEVIAKYERKSLFYSQLSKVAWQIGDASLAQQLAEKALHTSSEAGWVEGFDGGTRLQAVKALIRINPEQAKQQAFDLLRQDLVVTNFPMRYALELRTIIPLLNDAYDVERVWEEIADHLNRLFAGSNPLTDLPELIPSDKGIIESLTELRDWLTHHDVY